MAIAVFTIKYHTPSFTIIYNVYNHIYVHTVSRLQYHWLLSMYGHHRCLEDVRLSRVDQQIDRWPGPAGPAGSLVWGRRTACRLFSSRDNICPLYTNQMIIVTLHKPKPTFGTHSKAWLRIASSAPPPQAPFHPSKADCGYVRHSPLVRFALQRFANPQITGQSTGTVISEQRKRHQSALNETSLNKPPHPLHPFPTRWAILVGGILHVHLLEDSKLTNAKGNASQEGQNVGLWDPKWLGVDQLKRVVTVSFPKCWHSESCTKVQDLCS